MRAWLKILLIILIIFLVVVSVTGYWFYSEFKRTIDPGYQYFEIANMHKLYCRESGSGKWDLERCNNAIDNYQKTIEFGQDPELRADAAIQAFNMFMNLEKYNEAANYIRTLDQIAPNKQYKCNAKTGGATILERMGNYEEAIALYEVALDFCEDELETRRSICYIYSEKLNNCEKAKEVCPEIYEGC